MKPDELREWLRTQGYEEDRFGNMKKTDDRDVRRFQFKKKVVRYERQYKDFEGKNSWARIGSGFYGKLSIKDGKLSGLQR